MPFIYAVECLSTLRYLEYFLCSLAHSMAKKTHLNCFLLSTIVRVDLIAHITCIYRINLPISKHNATFHSMDDAIKVYEAAHFMI